VRETIGIGTLLTKVLLIEREWLADRTAVVLVRAPLGI